MRRFAQFSKWYRKQRVVLNDQSLFSTKINAGATHDLS